MTVYPWSKANPGLVDAMRIAASYDNAKHGQLFLTGFLGVAKNLVAFDFVQGRWLILDHEGRPVCVENDGTVKAGLGKKKGLNIKELSVNGRMVKVNQALLNAMDIAASYDNAEYGHLFLKCYLAVVKNYVAFDFVQGRCLIVDHEGRPVCVENDGTVKAGLGHKNGLNIK